MIEIFKMKNNLNSTFMKKIFTERNIPYSLRSENHLQLPKVKTGTHGIENIQYRGCHLWSSLPREIKDSNTLAEFKRKIKSWDGNTCICRLCKVFINRATNSKLNRIHERALRLVCKDSESEQEKLKRNMELFISTTCKC